MGLRFHCHMFLSFNNANLYKVSNLTIFSINFKFKYLYSSCTCLISFPLKWLIDLCLISLHIGFHKDLTILLPIYVILNTKIPFIYTRVLDLQYFTLIEIVQIFRFVNIQTDWKPILYIDYIGITFMSSQHSHSTHNNH